MIGHVLHRIHPSLIGLTLLGMATLPARGQEGQTLVVLPQAHAHNDYRHERPLDDALDHGFCGVEADIYLVDGELLVGHDPPDLQKGKTLQRLYLDPLQDRVKRNGGRVHPDGPTITLLIDIKTDGEQVYEVLRESLRPYHAMLSGFENGEYVQRAVQIIISGDRPKESIAADPQRYVGIDGRLDDLESTQPAHLMPMISDRWGAHFRWQGVGEFPAAEREKLRAIVKRAHADGRRVRFWATPEIPALWDQLLVAGVDHLNTDQLDELSSFLRQRYVGGRP